MPILGNLRIPDRFKPGLSLLATMSDALYGEFFSASKKAPASFATNRELSVWISSEVSGIPALDIGSIVESLTSLYRVRVRSERSVSKVAQDITGATREFVKGLTAQFEERISALLALDAFNVASVKASELRADREKIYCDARILTDIRPVFEEVVGTLPSAAIILHTLKIGFHDSNSASHKELFVALDSKDIADIKKVLERAEEKERSLRSVLDAAKLRLIDLQ